MQVAREDKGPRRVIPPEVLMNGVFDEQPQHHVVEQRSLRDLAAQTFRQMRHNNFQIFFALTNIETERTVIEDRFLYKEHTSILRAAFQQVLRTLIHEVPTQV